MKGRVEKVAVLFGALVITALCAFVVIPGIMRNSGGAELLLRADNAGIDAGALFYTEVEQVEEAATYLRYARETAQER